MYSLYKEGILRVHRDDIEDVKSMHDPEIYKYTGSDEEQQINKYLMNQNVYSIAVIAL
jgi:hypothetical protein